VAKNRDKTADQEQTPKKKRSKLKLALVVLPVLVLLGVGGYFAYTMVLGGSSGPDQKAENGKEGPEANATRQAETAMVEMPTLLVNLADPLGKRYLKMTASLEVNSQEAADRISSKMPKIKDSMIMLLSSKTYEQLSSMENKILLKKGIVKRLNQILGTAVVRRVYFTEFIIQ
jgi:flagellar FliL protein